MKREAAQLIFLVMVFLMLMGFRLMEGKADQLNPKTAAGIAASTDLIIEPAP